MRSMANLTAITVLLLAICTLSASLVIGASIDDDGGGQYWNMARGNAQRDGSAPSDIPGFNGALKWRISASDRVSSLALGMDAIYSMEGGTLYAIDFNGEELWKTSIDNVDKIHSGPAVDTDGTIYVGSYDGIKAVSPEGDIIWSFITGSVVLSDIALDDFGNIVFASTSGTVYKVTSNGMEIWSLNLNGTSYSSPAIGSNEIIYFNAAGVLYAIDLSNGTILWETTALGVPALDDEGIVYAETSMGNFNAIYPNGTIKWTAPMNHSAYGACAIGNNGMIYVNTRGSLISFDQDGVVRWEWQHGEDYYLNSPVLTSDGKILVYVRTTFYALDDNGNRVWRKEVGVHYTPFDISPAIDNDGTVYFYNQQQLFAFGEREFSEAFGLASILLIFMPIISAALFRSVGRSRGFKNGGGSAVALAGGLFIFIASLLTLIINYMDPGFFYYIGYTFYEISALVGILLGVLIVCLAIATTRYKMESQAGAAILALSALSLYIGVGLILGPALAIIGGLVMLTNPSPLYGGSEGPSTESKTRLL